MAAKTLDASEIQLATDAINLMIKSWERKINGPLPEGIKNECKKEVHKLEALKLKLQLT